MNGINENEDLSYMFDDETTPAKACGDLAYQVTSFGRLLRSYKHISSLSFFASVLFIC